MKSRTLLNLALLVLTGIAALVAVYLPGLTKPVSPTVLTTLQPDQVKEIQILRPGQPDIRLVKQATGWIMTSPYKLPANGMNVRPLLDDILQSHSQAQLAAGDHDLGKFQLAKPAVRLRLNNTEIAFGDIEPLAQRRYVLVKDTVHLISEAVYDRLIADPITWVSSALLPPGSKPVGLDLPELKLIKQTDGRWNLTPPAPDVSADVINQLIEEWTHAQALQVKPYEKGAAQGEVQVYLQPSGNPLGFKIIQRTPEFILARPDAGVQYHLTPELAERLLKLPLPEAPTPQSSE